MKSKARPPAKAQLDFDVESYLSAAASARKVVSYRRGEVVFSQGDAADDVRYIQKGAIKLSVLSRIGKEAVVAMLGPGDFFGEGALAGQPVRIGTATAVGAEQRAQSSRRTRWCGCSTRSPRSRTASSRYMLARNIRIEADLVDQLFNSSEKRLARTLLLLARYGEANPQPQRCRRSLRRRSRR